METLEKEVTKSHYDQYETYVQMLNKRLLDSLLPTKHRDELIAAFKEDPHLNTIPLYKWEGFQSQSQLARRCASNISTCPNQRILKGALVQITKNAYFALSVSQAVCVLKHYALFHIIRVQPKFSNHE